MGTILVTGGNIGNHVAQELAVRGLPVRVLVHDVTQNSLWDRLGIQQIAPDFRDAKSLLPAMQGAEKFFSLNPVTENFVEFAVGSIQAAKQSGVRYVVRSSVMGADDNGITIGRWHREVEKAVESSGIPYTILQPNAFMQNFLLSAPSITSSGAFYQPLGDGRVSYVDVRDIAAVAATVLTEPGHEARKYVLTGPEALSNSEVASKFAAALMKTVQYVDVPPEQAESSLREMGMPEWMARIYSELFAICKAGYASSVSADVPALLKREAITFDEFVTDHIRVFAGTNVGAASG